MTAPVRMTVLGVLMGVSALWSLAAPGVVGSQWAHVALGALLVASPTLLGFTYLAGMTWTASLLGLLVVLVSLSAVPASRQARRTLARRGPAREA